MMAPRIRGHPVGEEGQMTRRMDVVMVLLLLASTVLAEDFARIGPQEFPTLAPDARGDAMGLATTVDPRGAAAFWWSPAPRPGPSALDVQFHLAEHPAPDYDAQAGSARFSTERLTVGVAVTNVFAEDILVRTAYEPDGDGRLIDISNVLTVGGVAYDVAPWLSANPHWQWMVGASLRAYRQEVDDEDDEAVDLDLGTSVATDLIEDDSLAIRLHASTLVRNVLGADRPWTDEIDLPNASFPREWHGGLGLEAWSGRRLWGRPLVGATVSATLQRDLDGDRDHATEHLGGEVVLADLLALRGGYRSDDGYGDAAWSWGAGVRIDLQEATGLLITADYATHVIDWPLGRTRQEQWTFGVAWRSL
jgi:hypothetical protein